MMNDLDRYIAIISGEIPIPSWLFAVLPLDQEAPGITEIMASIKAAFPDTLVSLMPLTEKAGPAGQWRAETIIDWGGEKKKYTLWLQHKEKIDNFHFERRGFSDEDKDVTTRSTWVVGIETTFGDFVLDDFHHQLKVLNALDLNPPAVLDLAACTLHPGSWFREAAETETPPDPTNLFCIHAVSQDNRDDTPVWLHTHGLLRCGTIEFEMMNVDPQYYSSMAELLNVIAMLSLSNDLPTPDSLFEPAAGLPVVWLPFEKGIGKFPASSLGGKDDRDEYHSNPSGMIFRRRGFWMFKNYVTPNSYGEILEDNPLIHISSEETERMAQLAAERFDQFARYFERFKDSESWVFLVKLGYTQDEAEYEDDREHLWFQVHALDGERVEATLMNEPYHIARMKEGDRDWHNLDHLTDWAIMCQKGTFSPDKISLLDKEIGT